MCANKTERMIQTLHPEGKKNFKISEAKYTTLKRAIIRCLKTRGELAHTQLLRCVAEGLGASFDGSISWYMETVKLDLEARGIIERVKGSQPQRFKLV